MTKEEKSQQKHKVQDFNNQSGFINYLKDNGLVEIFRKADTGIRNDIDWSKCKLDIPIDKKKEICVNFYTAIFGKTIGAMVKTILENNHPDYVANIFDYEGSAGVHTDDKACKIVVNLYCSNTIQGLETMCHEIAHALTGAKHTQLELAKMVKNSKGLEKKRHQNILNQYKNGLGNPNRDCVGEIETMTIEKLLVWFLKHNYSQELLTDYNFDIKEYAKMYTLIHENDIFNRVNNIVTCADKTDSLLGLCKDHKIKIDNNTIDFAEAYDKIQNIADTQKRQQTHQDFEKDILEIASRDCKYGYRYIFGEAVSKHWVDKFLQTNTQQEKTELLKKLVDFWQHTDTITAEDSAQMLCEEDKTNLVKEYLTQSHIYSSKISKIVASTNIV